MSRPARRPDKELSDEHQSEPSAAIPKREEAARERQRSASTVRGCYPTPTHLHLQRRRKRGPGEGAHVLPD